MDGAELVQRFGGATIDGRYASGKAFTERYEPDGRLTYTEHSLTLGGHWSVTEGTLCTIYDGDASGGCYRVARVAPNCYEFYFVSRTEDAAPGPPDGIPRWTARGAVQGQIERLQGRTQRLAYGPDVKQPAPSVPFRWRGPSRRFRPWSCRAA